MNSFLAVIIPPEAEDPQEWVEQTLMPYDLNYKVKQYRDYLSPQEEQYLMEYHDFDTRLEFMLKMNHPKEIYFEDEHGIYQLSERNNNWKWSDWSVGGIEFEKFEIPRKLGEEKWELFAITVEDLQAFGFSALLCPKGKWYDCHQFGWEMINESFSPQKNLVAWGKWQMHAEKMLQDHENHLLLSVVYQC